jgi:iduronate 2-sulfatase
MFLRFFCLFFFTPLLLHAADRPNVLFIAVDDMNNDLGCYGHPLVKTPNLDKLAAQGVKFDRAYCQFPLCSPSRSSIMTGLRPDRTKVHDLQYHFREGLPDVVTLGQLFKNNGWFSARVGKIYHYSNPGGIGTPGLDDAPTWDLSINPAGRDKLVDEPDIIQYTGKKGTFGASLSWLAAEGTDSDHTDGKVADEAIRLLEEKKDQPFFLAVGFYKPHTPYVAPKKYFDLYPPADQIPLSEVRENDRADIPPLALRSNDGSTLNDEQRRLLRRAYWACISFADAQIGRVLDALDRLKLREKTIVVFWSDHGYHLGEHGLWQKQNCFEEVARVPLIISVPGTKAPGSVSRATVELLDLYPTLADLAGLNAPAQLQGTSLRPLLGNPAASWSRPAFTQCQRGKQNGEWVFGRSVRTDRWRYTEWKDGAAGVELYDHDKDPKEYTNLAQDPQFAAERAALAKLLKEAQQ